MAGGGSETETPILHRQLDQRGKKGSRLRPAMDGRRRPMSALHHRQGYFGRKDWPKGFNRSRGAGTAWIIGGERPRSGPRNWGRLLELAYRKPARFLESGKDKNPRRGTIPAQGGVFVGMKQDQPASRAHAGSTPIAKCAADAGLAGQLGGKFSCWRWRAIATQHGPRGRSAPSARGGHRQKPFTQRLIPGGRGFSRLTWIAAAPM